MLAAAGPPLCLALGVAVLFAGSGCTAPTAQTNSTQHVRVAEPLVNVEIGKLTRRAFRLRESRTEVALAEVGPGPLPLFVARAAVAGAPSGLRVTMECRDWRWWLSGTDNPNCRIRKLARRASKRWRRCALEIPRHCSRGALHIESESVAAANLVVAKPSPPLPVHQDLTNVFFVVVDTVRADRMRPFSKTATIGRYVSRLGRRSLVFRRARSTSSWTRPAVVSMLTGLRADSHAVHNRSDVMSEAFVTLPEILQAHGYFTAAFSTNPNILPMWGFDQGFDEFHDINASSWAHLKPEASEVMDRAIETLEQHRGQRGFYYIHLMDAHAPYTPSPEDRARVNAIPELGKTFPKQPITQELGLEYLSYLNYLGELIDIDDAIGRLWKHLDETNRLRNSMVVFVSDHGEEFLDHGLKFHGNGLFEEVLRAVLLIKAPSDAALRGISDAAVGVEDIAPTLLDLLLIGHDVPFDGESLVEPVATAASAGTDPVRKSVRFAPARWLEAPPRPRFGTLKLDKARVSAVIVEPWKLIQYHHADSTLLYNLAEDPLEKRDLFKLHPRKVQEMLALLGTEAARHGAGWHVLACSGTSQKPIELRVSTAGAALESRGLESRGLESRGLESRGLESRGLESRGLESDDAVTNIEGGVAVHLSLPIVERDVERLGEITKLRDQDNDELLMPLGATWSAAVLSASGDGGLRFTLGKSKEIRRAPSVDLGAVAAEAATTGAEWIECPLSETDLAGVAVTMEPEPYLRIWHVPGTRTVAEGEMSPKVSERLRGLGYAW